MPESVWKPNEGSQAEAFDLNANEILYWGDRGPGKTSWQIARALSRFFLGYGRFYKVLMMGLRVKSLSGCAAEVERVLIRLESYFKVTCRRRKKEGDWGWFAPDGEEFRIINLKQVDQAEDMIGQEYNVQLWNEICHYPSPKLYIMLAGSARSSFDPVIDTPKAPDGTYKTFDGKPLPPCPEETLAASNTKGVGKLWVRKKFIEPVEPCGDFQRREFSTRHVIRGQTEIFKTASIQGVQGENPKLTTRYLATLREQTKHDPALRREWCEGGDWYTPSGGAFDHLWAPERHVILGEVKIPREWHCSLSIYFSSSFPTCVLWSAETDVDTHFAGQLMKAGSVIFFHELYFCDEGDPHLGTRISVRELANTIVAESKKLVEKEIVGEEVVDGFGSRHLFVPVAGGMLADRLADGGVFVDETAQESYHADAREVGLAVVRERLSASAVGEEDGIYFAENCVNCIRTLPDLPIDEDDPEVIDEDGEHYCYQAVRIRAMSMSAPIEDLDIGLA